MTKISFYFSTTSAEKIKADKDVAAPLKELGLRVSKFLVSEAALALFFIPGMDCYWDSDIEVIFLMLSREKLKVLSVQNNLKDVEVHVEALGQTSKVMNNFGMLWFSLSFSAAATCYWSELGSSRTAAQLMSLKSVAVFDSPLSLPARFCFFKPEV